MIQFLGVTILSTVNQPRDQTNSDNFDLSASWNGNRVHLTRLNSKLEVRHGFHDYRGTGKSPNCQQRFRYPALFEAGSLRSIMNQQAGPRDVVANKDRIAYVIGITRELISSRFDPRPDAASIRSLSANNRATWPSPKTEPTIPLLLSRQATGVNRAIIFADGMLISSNQESLSNCRELLPPLRAVTHFSR